MQPFNKYYPKDFDPKKHNSVNQHVGVHPLGARARKLKSEGILIIRFELPFNIWCLGCNKHIGMGVRYNAEKKKVGNYYSTPIWSFRMKCHLCPNWIEIHTDPKNTRYVVASGAKQKVEEFDPADAGTMQINDESTTARIASDPLFKLEHATLDQQRAKIANDELEELKETRDAHWEDPYAMNQELRRKFREDKKKRQVLAKEATEIQDRIGTTIPILPEAPEDAAEARLILTDAARDRVAAKVEQRKTQIMSESIFARSSAPSSSSALHRVARPATKRAGSSSKTSVPSRLQRMVIEAKRAQGK
ncbi:hypothetical protein AMAG_07644 [Allomyces macrogynus ATCC 38327]|uniref:Coiled-coil domain-containing protein 130 n=2 Tax=Allomyces macrogynus (strain ATCC 38327) TaxID=578462 RepID=A0A0L0SJ68_ALLM3|nr:hypothetical protein AMAG_07644 [Allomyces macrogynus ATCC 38327]|eukprot:KNE62425.1 hypothetical protein AMAG_07644 [Allomyces macrogynus ATCC 38327]